MVGRFDGSVKTTDHLRELALDIGKSFERQVRDRFRLAMGKQAIFCEYEIRTRSNAKIRRTVADEDRGRTTWRRPEIAARNRAFAGARLDIAVGSRMRKFETVPMARKWDQSVGLYSQSGKRVIGQDAFHCVVDSVTDNVQCDIAGSFAYFDKGRESGIDFDRVEIAIEIPAIRLDERNLARHALTRAELSGQPLLLDVHPRRIRKSIKQAVGHILQRNRTVKIADDIDAWQLPLLNMVYQVSPFLCSYRIGIGHSPRTGVSGEQPEKRLGYVVPACIH